MHDFFLALSRLDLIHGWQEYAEIAVGGVLPVMYFAIRFLALGKGDGVYKRRLNLWGAAAILLACVGLHLCLLQSTIQSIRVVNLTGALTQSYSLIIAKTIACQADPAKLHPDELASAVTRLRAPDVLWKDRLTGAATVLAANAELSCDRIPISKDVQSMTSVAADAAFVNRHLLMAWVIALFAAPLFMFIALLRAADIPFSWPSLRKGSTFWKTRAPGANGANGNADESARW